MILPRLELPGCVFYEADRDRRPVAKVERPCAQWPMSPARKLPAMLLSLSYHDVFQIDPVAGRSPSPCFFHRGADPPSRANATTW